MTGSDLRLKICETMKPTLRMIKTTIKNPSPGTEKPKADSK